MFTLNKEIILRPIFIYFLLITFTFATKAQFVINGNAVDQGQGDILLTNPLGYQVGSIWYQDKISLGNSFELTFELYFGNKDNGADGMTFCLQPLNTSIGVSGGGLGIAGVQPSFFAEFDTYKNGGEVYFDHLALQKNGSTTNSGVNNLTSPVQIKAGFDNVEDGQWYAMKATWNANLKKFELFVDCELRVVYTGDIVNEIFNGDPMVFWGFTASTGGANNEHRVRNIKTNFITINDKTICKGESVLVDIPPTSNSFTWTPTAGINDVTSLTPLFSPTLTTEYIIAYDRFCGTQVMDTILIEVNNCGCNDNDNDGICDEEDLDDDNDGILDEVECPNAYVTQSFQTSGGATTTFLAPSADGGFRFDVFKLDNSFNLNVNGVDVVPDQIQCQGSGSIGESLLVFESDNTGFGQSGNDNIWVINGDAIEPVIRLTVGPNGAVSFHGKRNSGRTLEPMRILAIHPQASNITWNTDGNNTVVLSQKVVGPTNISGEGNGVVKCTNDTDGDGVYDYLDTDSDGDGCLDALEGARGFEKTDLLGERLKGTVDANGIPILANGGQGIGLSRDPNVVSLSCKEPLCGGNINFNSWNQVGIGSEGNWAVSSDGSSVNQSINGAPTFFVGNREYLNVNFSGNMRTDFGGDDDWMGMVFGYQGGDIQVNYPISIKTYVFMWKQKNQGNYQSGFTLFEVNGTFNNKGDLQKAFAFPFNDATVLASDYGTGYQTGKDYTISIDYSSSNIKTYVDGALIFDIDGCFDEGKIGFFNYSQPDVTYSDFTYQFIGNIDVLDDTLCIGEEVELAVYEGSSCNKENFYPIGTLLEWDLKDGTTSIENKVNYTYQDSGVYDIQLVISDGIGCSDTTFKKVYVSSYPIKSLGNDTTVCGNTNLVLNAKNDGDAYLWNTNQTSQNIEVNIPGEYSLNITNWANCSTSDTVNVSFDNLPIVDLGNDINICEGDSVVLDAQNLGLIFSWNTGEQTQTVKIDSSGIFSVEVKNANGCIGNDSLMLKVNKVPVANLGNDTVICFGESVRLNAQNSGFNYQWNTGASSIDLIINTAGKYEVRISDEIGCADTSEMYLSINPLPEVNLGNDTAICDGKSIVLDAKNTGLNYIWSDGSITQEVTVTQIGVYNVEVTDEIGCLGKGEMELIVHVMPNVDLGNDTIICVGESVTLNAQNSGLNYQWNTGASSRELIVKTTGKYEVKVYDEIGCADTSEMYLSINPLPEVNLGNDVVICEHQSLVLNAQNESLSYVWSTSDTTQIIEVTSEALYSVEFTDEIGCLGTDEIFVTKEIIDDPYFEKEKDVCEGTTIVLTPDFERDYTISWQLNPFSSSIEVSETDTYLSFVQSEFCKDTFFVEVSKIDTPDVLITDLGGRESYCFEYESTTLRVNTDATDLVYDWTDFGRVDEIDIETEGLYNLTVTNEFCSSLFQKEIKEYCEGKFFIPNAFTPADDNGLNEVFLPISNGHVDGFDFRIYNRWGVLIFQTNVQGKGWNGRVSDNIVQSDVYVYKIGYNSPSFRGGTERKEQVGTVTLLK